MSKGWRKDADAAWCQWTQDPIPQLPGAGCACGGGDSPKVQSAGPQRHSSHCPAEEEETWSCGNEHTKIPKCAELLKMKGSAGASSTQDQRPSKQVLVRVAGTRAVCIPPHSAMNVDVTGLACGPNAVVEPLSTTLIGGLRVVTTLVDASKSCFTVQLINPTSQGVSLKPRKCLGMVQPAEVITREQLAFTVESNEVLVSIGLDVDCRRHPRRPPSRTTQQQENNTLPEGCCWMISLVLLQKRESKRESSESTLMCLPERGRKLAISPPCTTESTQMMTFWSTNATGGSHPTSSRR